MTQSTVFHEVSSSRIRSCGLSVQGVWVQEELETRGYGKRGECCLCSLMWMTICCRAVCILWFQAMQPPTGVTCTAIGLMSSLMEQEHLGRQCRMCKGCGGMTGCTELRHLWKRLAQLMWVDSMSLWKGGRKAISLPSSRYTAAAVII